MPLLRLREIPALFEGVVQQVHAQRVGGVQAPCDKCIMITVGNNTFPAL